MGLHMFHLGAQLRYRGVIIMRILSATYKTNRGHDGPLGIYNERAEPRDRVGRAKFIQDAEDMGDVFNMDDPDSINIAQQDEFRRRTRIKRKIIERKYFRKPQEQNLLTWDAKEQMRYLHQEFPDDWTVDRLAESFPTSRDGVLKILGSSWQPESLSEVIRHDKRVQKRWLALSVSGTGKEGGPIELRYQKLLDAEKLALAAGNPSLPAPPTATRFLIASKPQPLGAIATLLPTDVIGGPKSRRNRGGLSKGPFESLIEGYCKQKAQEEAVKELENKDHAGERYAKHRDLSQDILQQVVSEVAPLVKSKSKLEGKPERRDLLGVAGGREYGQEVNGSQQGVVPGDRSLFDMMQRMTSSQAEAILSGEGELAGNEPTERSSDSHCMERKSLRMHVEPRLAETLDMGMSQLQMAGTGRVESGDLEDGTEEDGRVGRGRAKKYASDRERSQVLSRIRYDISRGSEREGQTAVKEAYIYTEQTGYQYPLGLTDHTARIKVPKHGSTTGQSRLYQKGKAVYDEQGELLYRIP